MLPTLGFKVVDGSERILPLIRSGAKAFDLRRKGSCLSDGTVLDGLRMGDRFVGVPLARHLRYRAVLEVTGPVLTFASHGAAWEVLRAQALPKALGEISSGPEAQRYIECTFYGGRRLSNEPVVAVPVRVHVWDDRSASGRLAVDELAGTGL
jgi:hypothetical protein